MKKRIKIRSSGPVWFLIVGVPALALCVFGILATLMGAYWIDDRCRRWVKEMTGE